jgi:hypothetical protein
MVSNEELQVRCSVEDTVTLRAYNTCYIVWARYTHTYFNLLYLLLINAAFLILIIN